MFVGKLKIVNRSAYDSQNLFSSLGCKFVGKLDIVYNPFSKDSSATYLYYIDFKLTRIITIRRYVWYAYQIKQL